MQKFQFTQIGTFHTNHNEDCLVTREIGDNKCLIAVMDGCSSAIDSHFAANLIAKCLRKIAKEEDYKEFATNIEKPILYLLKDVLSKLFKELNEFKQYLDLSREELLSTVVLGIIHTKNREAEIIVIGDGVICSNSNFYEFDHDNKPDYLGYHLDKDFDNWFELQNQKLSLKNINDLSISTDGIFTFMPFDNKKEYEFIDEKQILELLLIDQTNMENENMLHQKVFFIEKTNGLKPTDDLTIIRMIL